MQRVLFDHHIDRHSFVVVIGGGAVLDAVGLVAATTHRGVRLIRVPTTVLAQQHFNTFSDRFEPYPAKVELLSRYRTP